METQERPFSQRRMILWGGILIVLLIVALIPLFIPHPHGVEYETPELVDFSLPRADGGTFQLSDYRGEVVVVYFGYTECPDVCPTTMYDLKRALETLNSDADEVEIVFVTIDPETDTPDRLTTYLNVFNPDFIGLYGSTDELESVYTLFDVELYNENTPGSSLEHTSTAFVIDRAGRLRLKIHFGTSPKNIADDLKMLLKERAS
jgi:protein SCO1